MNWPRFFSDIEPGLLGALIGSTLGLFTGAHHPVRDFFLGVLFAWTFIFLLRLCLEPLIRKRRGP